MIRIPNRALRSRSRLVLLCGLTLLASQLAPGARAQVLPGFERFPADAPTRLARAVEDRVDDFAGSFGSELTDVATADLDRPDLRRNLWAAIEGVLTPGAERPAAGASASAGPTQLLMLLDGAIGAYMTELGRIALEMDQDGDRDAVSRLAALHPGEQGSGNIELGTVGAFRQLQINFRGEIAHPDGRSPAVVALFYLLPDGARRPIPGRLLIPTSGAMPSFRAEIATSTGASETRDYGWRPRLSRLGSILELNIDGRWARVEDETDVMPRRRTGRDPIGFCDAACVDR
jgi:hypothetical protein